MAHLKQMNRISMNFNNSDLCAVSREWRRLLGQSAYVALLTFWCHASLASESELRAGDVYCTEIGVSPIELTDVLVIALESQPQLLIAQEAAAKARANLMAARSPFLPNVTLALQSERFAPNTTTPPVTVGNVVVGGTTATKTSYGSIGLSWNLYSGGRDLAGYRATQAEMHSSEAGLSYQLSDTLMSILSAYSDVYQSQLDAEAQFKILALQHDIENRVEEQFRSGLTTTLAIAQAQTDVLESSQAVYQACRAVADKSATLAQAVGMHLGFDELYRISVPLPIPDDKRVDLTSVEWQKVIQDSPAVVAAKANVAAAEYRLKQVKAAYGPSLSLEGRKDYLGQDPDSWRAANHIEPNSYRIGLQIKQPILPMTSEYSAVQAAKSDLRKAQASYQQALLETEGKYHTAFNAVREADASLKAAEGSLIKAGELLGLTQSLYAAGRVDLDKVRQSEVAVEKAQNAVNGARAKQRLSFWMTYQASDPQAFPNRVLAQLSRGGVAVSMGGRY